MEYMEDGIRELELQAGSSNKTHNIVGGLLDKLNETSYCHISAIQ